MGIRKAIGYLRGKKFSQYHELETELIKIRLKVGNAWPPDFGTDELYRLARKRGYITEDKSGTLIITV